MPVPSQLERFPDEQDCHDDARETPGSLTRAGYLLRDPRPRAVRWLLEYRRRSATKDRGWQACPRLANQLCDLTAGPPLSTWQLQLVDFARRVRWSPHVQAGSPKGHHRSSHRL